MPRTCSCRCDAAESLLSFLPLHDNTLEEESGQRRLPTMALMNQIVNACCKSFRSDARKEKPLFVLLRALHKSATHDALRISAAGEESVQERLITAAEVGEKSRAKPLKEMPGPSTISNLVEFFWRDGFSRIHEIQVSPRFYRAYC